MRQDDKKIDKVSDVTMMISVELGRASRPFKEILDMQPGTVIELATHEGDRVNCMVNNNLVAQGEVMVIHGKYALRITEIVGSLQKAVRDGLDRR